MARGFTQTYTRRVGPFKMKHREIINEVAELMIEDHIKNIKDEKTPGRRPQKKNTSKTLERKAAHGWGSKSLVERRKSLQNRVGWAKDIRVTNRGGSVTIRPSRRRLTDEAVDGLLAKGYDFVGTSRRVLNRINKLAAKKMQQAFDARKIKTTTFK